MKSIDFFLCTLYKKVQKIFCNGLKNFAFGKKTLCEKPTIWVYNRKFIIRILHIYVSYIRIDKGKFKTSFQMSEYLFKILCIMPLF